MNKEAIINPLELDTLCEHLDNVNCQLRRKISNLEQENEKLKDNWNKLKEILNIKLARLENEPDYCNYYVEGLENSVILNQKSISGVSIEMVKKAIINAYKELLYEIYKLEKGESNE